MVAMAMDPMENLESSSPFQCCRLFLNQLGFMHWGMRPHFNLLKKSEKLLRELKNLDKQMWYVTSIVFTKLPPHVRFKELLFHAKRFFGGKNK